MVAIEPLDSTRKSAAVVALHQLTSIGLTGRKAILFGKAPDLRFVAGADGLTHRQLTGTEKVGGCELALEWVGPMKPQAMRPIQIGFLMMEFG